MKLYSYFRSSAAYRVRIALNLKGLDYTTLPVNLLLGEQNGEPYKAVNAQGLVPALETPGGDILSQSVAILEWLEECYPDPPLLPADALARASVRSFTLNIACEVHPILNLAVLNYLKGPLAAGEDQVREWYHTWIHRGFGAMEQTLRESAGQFCFGDTPTMADCCLVPQVFNALRFEVPMEEYPVIMRVREHCNSLAAFADAHPMAQPDAPTS